ncbi:MAG: hypothetical protein WCR81_09465 [Fermentimonas sp.]|jgi:hypothetical protein
MKRLFYLIALCLIGNITFAQQPVKKTLFIVVDGIPVDIFTYHDALVGLIYDAVKQREEEFNE